MTKINELLATDGEVAVNGPTAAVVGAATAGTS
jgi:hypothetical protein